MDNERLKIDLVDLPEELDDCYITRHFLETRKGHRTTLSWLQTLNTDTLEMIIKVCEVDMYPTEAFKKNPSLHDYAAPKTQEQRAEGADIFLLSCLLEEMEYGIEPDFEQLIKPDTTIEDDQQRIKDLYILSVFEYFRRHGLIRIKGDGKMTTEETSFNFIRSPEDILDFIEKTEVGEWMIG